MRISDWSSDVCSSDLVALVEIRLELRRVSQLGRANRRVVLRMREQHDPFVTLPIMEADAPFRRIGLEIGRSEEHTSELQSLMRLSYAVFCLKKNKPYNCYTPSTHTNHFIHILII